MKSKKVYIIPGYNESARQDCYVEIAALFEQRNITAIPVSIHWKYRTFSNYVSQLLLQIQTTEHTPILFGFSFGAMVAFLASLLVSPEKLYLCSLSPFFKEDLLTAGDESVQVLGKKRTREMQKISLTERAAAITCPTTLLVGSEEDPAVIQRTKNASKLINHAELHIVEGATHSLSDPAYFNTLKKIII